MSALLILHATTMVTTLYEIHFKLRLANKKYIDS
jgi:hypothetical protein